MLPADILREIILLDLNNLPSISLVCRSWYKVAKPLMTRLVFSRAMHLLPSISLLMGERFSVIVLAKPDVVSVRIYFHRHFTDGKIKSFSLHYIQRGRDVYLLSQRGLRKQHRSIDRIIWYALEGMKKDPFKILKFVNGLDIMH